MKFPFIVRQRGLFWALLAGTCIAFVVLSAINRPLKTSAAPQGIISLQLAYTPAAAQAILASWDVRARMFAGFSLGFDYLFMVFYMTTLASVCVGVTGNHRAAWGVGIAAFLDAVENAAQWRMLAGGVVVPWPQLTGLCATVKFILLVLCGLYLAFVYGARRASR